ncbi:unnamed protein product [Dibothriocephalus latus]|uniref:Uncharacterized protein n=1 Tax=Dibothriocephalus latus TaxID=60516 RepID=A0A3P6TPM9_DIBLA|nr:unnamed protein product [Dibothriocephalus latus]
MDPLDCNIWMSFMCDVIQKHLCLCDFKENVDILQLCLKEGFGAAVTDKRHVADCKISSTLLNSISVNLVPGMFITFLTQLTDAKAVSTPL